ncbi:MAG: CoA pyrophosphatase [Planctomycetes bacterium]|nr:CoA pyrophosphatase [Planctomycetota bacterium]
MTSFDDLLPELLDPVPVDWPATALRRAAVLCPIVEHGGHDHLLFTKRPETLGRHAGQIGFPGGMRDGGEDPTATAIRECREELGIAPDRLRVLGALQPRASTSGIQVLCLVGRLVAGALTPDPREVERVIEVPLRELREETRWAEKPPPYRVAGRTLPTSPHFRYRDDVIWGLTGRFTRELVQRLERM